MRTLSYRDRKKKQKKANWDKFRNQLKEEFIKTKELAKETFQDIKKQFNDEPLKEKKGIMRAIKKKPLDLNQDLFCPFCEHPIPKELISGINVTGSIVCENCGAEIKKNSFFKDYSFPD